MATSPSRRAEVALAFAVTVAVVAGVLTTGHVRGRHYSLEARQRTSVAADVVAGTSRGNQGLIGSLYLSPLPTVMAILVSLLPAVPFTPMLNSVVAAAAAVALAVYANLLWRRHGVPGTLRYPATVCIPLLPAVVLSVQTGRSSMVFAALAIGGGAELLEWLRQRRLHSLAVSAVLLGLSVATCYQGLLFVLGGLVLVVAAAAVEGRGWHYVEGTAIAFVLPALYVILLWVGGNWLVLGSPLFFLKAVTGPLALGTMDWRAVLAGDCPWMLTGVLAAFVLLVPLVSTAVPPGRSGAAQSVAAGLALVGLVVAGWLDVVPVPSVEPVSDARQVVRLLAAAYPNGTFIVTGYPGYDFARAAAPDPHNHWVHIMHLQPSGVDKVLDDYRGREVYLLLSAGGQRERWDEVDLAWHAPGGRIPERFLFARQVGEWTVFEVLRGRG